MRAYRPQRFLHGGRGRPAAGLLGGTALVSVLLAVRNILLLLAGTISSGVNFWGL